MISAVDIVVIAIYIIVNKNWHILKVKDVKFNIRFICNKIINIMD